MTSQYRHRRTSVPTASFPASIEPGEIAVNTANRQLAVGDAAAGSLGVPLPLLGVRIFDTRAVYALNDTVIISGVLYRSRGVSGPGIFNIAQWEQLFVPTAGGSMTGDLTITKDTPSIYLNKTATGQASVIVGQLNAKHRWAMSLGDAVAESDPQTGSDYTVTRFDNAGAHIDTPFRIDRANGDAYFAKTVSVMGQPADGSGGFWATSSPTTGEYYFGSDGLKSLKYDGTNFAFGGGGVYAPRFSATGDVVSTAGAIVGYGVVYSGYANAKAGSYYFGNDGTTALAFNGTAFNFAGGAVFAPSFNVGNSVYGATSIELGSAASAGATYIDFHSSGTAGDYDARIISTGGSVTTGQGTLTIHSAVFTASGPTHVLGSGAGGAVSLNLDGGTGAGGGKINFNKGPGGQQWLIGHSSAMYGGSASDLIIHNVAVGPAITISYATNVVGFGSAAEITLGTANTGSVSTPGGMTVGKNFQAMLAVYANGYACRRGQGGVLGGNQFNMHWTGGNMELWADTYNAGLITVTSDYRTKKDVLDLPGMWDTVKALRPIKYTQADFMPPSQVLANDEARAKALEDGAELQPIGPAFVADDVERWGFIAHELQDTLVPSASTGVKDAPDTVQSPNPFTVIAALTKALQEAMTRIEVLEAKVL